MYDRPPASDDAEVEELLRDGLGDVGARAGRRFGTRAAGGRFGARLGALLLPVRRHGGAMDMNPAVVDVHVRPGGRLVVRAAGKEGLIPQRTARKAVRKVIESLELAARAYSVAPPS